ncbi:hypothetical protein GCM10027280_62090 [Micromonospora polyrhachis]
MVRAVIDKPPHLLGGPEEPRLAKRAAQRHSVQRPSRGLNVGSHGPIVTADPAWPLPLHLVPEPGCTELHPPRTGVTPIASGYSDVVPRVGATGHGTHARLRR